MKICIVSPLGYTGIAYYDHSLCQSLSELGVDVVLITSQLRIISPPLVSYQIEYLFKDTYGDLGMLKKGINYVASLWRIFIYTLKNKCKIIHFQILELPPVDAVLFMILKLCGKKIVFTPHDIKSFKGWGSRALGFMYAVSDQIIVHNADNVTSLTRDFSIDERKIKVIHHGNYKYFLNGNISRAQAKNKIHFHAENKLILMFGNIRNGKGIATAIQASAKINAQNSFQLLLAGKVAKDFDKNLISEIPNYNFIALRDQFIDDAMVEYYYKAADIVLIPYEFAFESGVLRYAFSCGCPCVVSDLQIFSAFARDGDNCLVFKAGEVDALAANIEKLIRNPDLASKIGNSAKQYADKHWDWSQSAQESKNIYMQYAA